MAEVNPWRRPDCPPMQVEYLERPGQLQLLLLAEARSLSRALAQKGNAECAARLRQQLRNRLNLLALVVSEGRILPSRGNGD